MGFLRCSGSLHVLWDFSSSHPNQMRLEENNYYIGYRGKYLHREIKYP